MAWNFTIWKTFSGPAGRKAAVSIIAGSIGAGSLIWYLRPATKDQYYSTRDQAEIEAAFLEREIAMVDTALVDYWEPTKWYTSFPSTNGAISTNVIGRYPTSMFFARIEEDLKALLYPSWDDKQGRREARSWVDIGDMTPSEAYDGMVTNSVYGGYQPLRGYYYPFAIANQWWPTKIYPGPRNLPIDSNYVGTGVLHTIGRAFSASSTTVEGGCDTRYFGMTNVPLESGISLRWWAQAYDPDDFLPAYEDALLALADAEPFDSGSPTSSYSPAQLMAMLPYSTVLQHSGSIRLSRRYNPLRHYVTLQEDIYATPHGSVTVGSNHTVYAVTALRSMFDGFYHNRYGVDDPGPGIKLVACGPSHPVCPPSAISNTVGNLSFWPHEGLRWGGFSGERFGEMPYIWYFPAIEWGYTWNVTNVAFGWQTASDPAFVIDWQFSHFTNRPHFWSSQP